TDDLAGREVSLGKDVAQHLLGAAGFAFSAGGAWILKENAREPAEGWVRLVAPVSDFLPIKLLIVVVGGGADSIVVRQVALQDDAPAQHAASGAPGDLRQQLKRALASAKIGQTERRVRRNDADQR